MRAHARAIAVVIAFAAACAATRSGPSKKQLEYLKAHPLGADEERRLYAREARRGDTLDRVRVTFDDCDWDRARVEGDLVIWSVHVPVDAAAHPHRQRQARGARPRWPRAHHLRARPAGVAGDPRVDALRAPGARRAHRRGLWSRNGDLLWAKDGALCRNQRRLIDLAPLRFEPRQAPPRARRWD